MTPRAVLVTDGEQRAALALVRSLGRAGYRVYACSSRARSLAGASRYCRREARVSDVLTDATGFLTDVTALVAAWHVDVVIPVAEPSLLSVLSAPDRFGGVQIPFPDLKTFQLVSDKALILEIAPSFDIHVPEQWLLPCREARASLAATGLRFPVVVKPSRSVVRTRTGLKKLAVSYAADLAELDAQLAALDPAAYPLLLQRQLLGPGLGVFLLLWEGRIVALFSHRRIREKPPSGGVSVYSESVPADPALVKRSLALLKHFGWQGVAMVEYKLDNASGTPYLMEINGRFWGSLQLAVDAGVDFPALLLAAAAGNNPPSVTQYRSGVRCRWWWGDVDHLLARLRRSGDSSRLVDSPSRWQSIRDFLTLWRPGDRHEVLRLDDPRPFVRETIDWFRRR